MASTQRTAGRSRSPKLDELHEKPLPQSEEAERALLGVVLNRPEELLRALEHVHAKDFFNIWNQNIFRTIEGMYAEGHKIDTVTVAEMLNSRGLLPEAGGYPYLASLGDGIPRGASAAEYGKLVAQTSKRRRLISLCRDVTKAAYGAKSSRKLFEWTSKEVAALLAESDAALPETWRTAVSSAMNEVLESIAHPESVMRMLTGVSEIDELVSGLRRKDLALLVGQTSHGKTVMAMQFATWADSHGLKGLIFSAEMSKEALVKRELAHTSGIPMFFLRRPEAIRDKVGAKEKLIEAAAQESQRRLLVIDRDITPIRVKTLSELVHRIQGLDFIVVDYDQLVVRAGGAHGDDQFAEQARFVADALDLAKRLDICFILLCQPRKVDIEVSRGKRAPRVEDIFGSSAIANTAHVIMWIVRTYFHKGMEAKYERDAKLYVLKARNDKAGMCHIAFDPEMVLFAERPPSEKDSTKERE